MSGEIPPELGSLSNLTTLWLEGNDLSGEIPAELGSLSNLSRLWLDSNDLSGEIPAELGSLSNLIRLSLNDNDLSGCVPGSLEDHLDPRNSDIGVLSYCTPSTLGSGDAPTGTDAPEAADATAPPAASGSDETDREALVALYNATDGENWDESDNWLSDAPLGEWQGVSTNDNGRVIKMQLYRNNLSGEIPAELGSLSNLDWLNLHDNNLSGEIPEELGSLSNLTRLSLNDNDLSGCVPGSLEYQLDFEYSDLGLPFC